MAQQLSNMKEAVVGGRGGGLQETSTKIGDTIVENATPSSGSKKADQATSELQSFGQGTGQTVQSDSVSASQQMANQQTGTADHLELGSGKRS